jgi:hypothetical protein
MLMLCKDFQFREGLGMKTYSIKIKCFTVGGFDMQKVATAGFNFSGPISSGIKGSLLKKLPKIEINVL